MTLGRLVRGIALTVTVCTVATGRAAAQVSVGVMGGANFASVSLPLACLLKQAQAERKARLRKLRCWSSQTASLVPPHLLRSLALSRVQPRITPRSNHAGAKFLPQATFNVNKLSQKRFVYATESPTFGALCGYFAPHPPIDGAVDLMQLNPKLVHKPCTQEEHLLSG